MSSILHLLTFYRYPLSSEEIFTSSNMSNKRTQCVPKISGNVFRFYEFLIMRMSSAYEKHRMRSMRNIPTL